MSLHNSDGEIRKQGSKLVPSVWVKFLAILSIVVGAPMCLGVVTIPLGIAMIFSGLKLLKAHKSMESYLITQSKEDLEEAIDNYNTYFKINGIRWLIAIALVVIALIIAIGLFLIGISLSLGDFIR